MRTVDSISGMRFRFRLAAMSISIAAGLLTGLVAVRGGA